MAKYSHQQAVCHMAAYYRLNPHRFAKDFLHLDLRMFQEMLLCAMNTYPSYLCIASRGLGKSFLIAVYATIRCILYPGTKVVIASSTRSQSINVLEKIKIELLPKSPELKAELINGDVKLTTNDAIAQFKNGSYIKVVTASDSARGNRANLLILDEFRMIDKDTIDTVLTKFLTASRQPGFLSNPKYKSLENQERNRQVYLSSAYFQDHWSYKKVRSFYKNMAHPELKWYMCAFPYQIAIMERLANPDDLADQMADEDFNEIKWSMEMLSEFYGSTDGAFFDFESVAKNRKIEFPMLPAKLAAKLNNDKSVRILPKQPGEIRLMSVDIALMSSKKYNNDATAVFINQLLPTISGKYMNNIIYTETFEGLRTDDQALQVRRLYAEFDCNYMALDTRGVGLPVYDALATDISDSETGEIYPALSCCNNPTLADRCTNKEAEKVIWAINANAQFNSDCALLLREGFKSGKIRLLQTEYDADKSLSNVKQYKNLVTSEQMKIQMPYINTTLLINELVNLQHDETNGLVKIKEKSGMRKDRYSSLSYNYWVACQLENKLRRKSNAMKKDDELFLFRAPKLK